MGGLTMNENVFKKIVSVGLIVLICLCGFLVFHENNGSAAENSVSDTNSSGDGLLKMFEEGLQQNSKEVNAKDPEYYYGMVEAAIQQSSQYPVLISGFWDKFKQHLDSSSSITPIARIELIDLFDQQAELCSNHCKNIEQYNNFWNTRENITAYKESVIKKEIEKSLKLLEDAKKEDSRKIVRVLKKESNDKDSLDLLIAYNFLTDYSSEMSDEQQKQLDNIVLDSGMAIFSEVEDKYNVIKGRFDTIKKKSQEDAIEPNIINENGNEIEYGIGDSYQLLLDLQTFVTTEMNLELLQTIPGMKTDMIIQLQKDVSDLLEKTRVLNQIRYNLWANFIIFNSNGGVNQISKISTEFLYPAVSANYHDKVEQIRKRNPSAFKITDDLYVMILKDKAPLSAF